MINKVLLIGRIGEAPEAKSVGSGDSLVVNTSMATNSGYYDKRDEWQEVTQWHRLVAWNKLAEKFEKLEKGQLIYVEGSLEYREYEDKNGVKHTNAEIKVQAMRVLNNRSEASSGGRSNSRNQARREEPKRQRSNYKEPENNSGEEDDLPF